MTPTREQQRIIDAARLTKDSLLVNALAGAAKTSTLCLVAQALPLQPTLCLAFNKRIADEMQRRMPGHVQCVTLNGLGHRAWARATGKRPKPDTGKTYAITKAVIEEMDKDEKRYGYSILGSIIQAIGLAKSAGYVPKAYIGISKPLVARTDLPDICGSSLDDEPDEAFLNLLDRVLERSIVQSFHGNIDFDDQVYMTTLFSCELPKYPVVLVDEAQDLSPLNHAMIEKLNPDRLIAVGDPWQSIYSFRGADRSSMSKLRKRFNMTELTLSVSFRCPQLAVERARFRVPHMRWRDEAPLGDIVELRDWTADHVPDGAAIICRANAPLFTCALRLIKAGRGVKVLGREIGTGLVRLLKKLGPPDMRQDAVNAAIAAWHDKEYAKASFMRKPVVTEKAECLYVFAGFGATLAEAIAYAEHLFKIDGPIQLMTGHKAKGLEFDTVFHLDPWRIPSRYAKEAAELGDNSQMDQEMNLRYVIETRWKERYFLCEMERMQ